MYAIYGNIYHQYAPNVTIYAIHGAYGVLWICFTLKRTFRLGISQPCSCFFRSSEDLKSPGPPDPISQMKSRNT